MNRVDYQRTWELALPGFVGGTDATDHLIVWINSTQDIIEGLDLNCFQVSTCDDDDPNVDFVLPRDIDALMQRIDELKESKPSALALAQEAARAELIEALLSFYPHGSAHDRDRGVRRVDGRLLTERGVPSPFRAGLSLAVPDRRVLRDQDQARVPRGLLPRVPLRPGRA